MASFSLSCSHCGASSDPEMERCHHCGLPLSRSSSSENIPQPSISHPKRSRRAFLWGAAIGSLGAVLLATGGYLTYRRLTDPHILTYADNDSTLDAAWSSDSQRIVSVSGDGNTLHIWHATTGEKLVTCTPGQPVTSGPPYLPDSLFDAGGKRVAWSEDGKDVLALVGPWERPMVQVWNARNGQRVRSFPVTPSLALGEKQEDGGIPLVNAWALNARYLAVVRQLLETRNPFGTRSFLDVWNIATGSRMLTVETTPSQPPPSYQVSTMVWAPDGEKLALGYASNGVWLVEIWNGLTGQRTPVLAGRETHGLAWSPQGTVLAVVTPQGTENIDAQTGHQVTAYPFIKTQFSLAWSPDEKRIAMTSYTEGHWVPTSGTLAVFDASHGSLLRQYDQGQQGIGMLGMGRTAWSPNGQFLLVLNGDINIWKME